MDATHRFFCEESDFINPLSSMGMQASCILVISHFFNLVLKAFGQPGPIAQLLAGLVLGPSGVSNITKVREIFIQNSSADYYEVFSFFCRILIMFLIGLEFDISYAMHNLRIVSLLAIGGLTIGFLFGFAISFYLYETIGDNTKIVPFFMIIMLVLAYSSSPIVIRVAGELKFMTSDVGRKAISSTLITEMLCMMVFNLTVAFHSGPKVLWTGSCALLLTFVVVMANKYLAQWFNGRNRNQKHLRAPYMLCILSIVICSSMVMELWGYNSMINCFLVGLMFPREGKTARTLLHKLTFSIHNFVLPIYFGYIGFQIDVSYLNNANNVIIVLGVVLLSIGSKLSGTLIVCRYLKIPPNEGIFLGFMMNMRGHGDLLFIGNPSKAIIFLTDTAYNVLVIAIILSTIISGVVVAFLAREEEKMLGHFRTTLEYQLPNDELRILACVYGSRNISAMLALIATLDGAHTTPMTTHLVHLIELIRKSKSNVLYHEKMDHDDSDDEQYGGNDALEIHDAVDAFTVETKILVYQKKSVSHFATLFEDVCNDSEDLRVSILLLPFHKHQRIDGKMESGKEDIRTTNQKLLRHAPTTIGVLVERGCAGVPGFSQIIGSDNIQNVATLFFGGPDDREAIAWSIRIAKHPRVNLTVIRFLLKSSASRSNPHVDDSTLETHDKPNEKEVFVALSDMDEMANSGLDTSYMADFYNRYVASGQMGYVEKYLTTGEDTVAALEDIGDMYSLFIVGKGGRGNSPLTTGLSDWEECPELGTIGDLLASSEFNTNGSVLVVQQHRHAKEDVFGE